MLPPETRQSARHRPRYCGTVFALWQAAWRAPVSWN